MELNEAQARAAAADGRVVITAGAGTGKTHTMTARYLALVTTHSLSPLEIVAVTFTNQAANELRRRVMARLAELGNSAARIEASSAPILTLHSLAERIAREFPEEAEAPPDFRILDELEAAQFRDAELPYLMATLPDELTDALDYDELLAWARTALADLDRCRRAAAVPLETIRARLEAERQETLRNPCWQEAHATLLQYRGPNGDRIEEQRLAAVAALERLAVDPESAFEVLASINLQGGKPTAWVPDVLVEVKDALRNVRERARDVPPWQRVGFTDLDEEHTRVLTAFTVGVEALAAGLAGAKRARGLLDFQDLELAAARALKHEHVRAELHTRIKAVLVDEAQDLSPLEHELLEAIAGCSTQLTFVGDTKQSLYGFRGADPEHLVALADGTTTHVVLEENFRSTPELIALTNEVFGQLLEGYRPIRSARSSLSAGSRIECLFPDGTLGERIGDARNELATRVARRLAALLAGQERVLDPETGITRPVEPRDLAVVSLSWSMLEVMAEALAAQGIPARVAQGGRLLATQEAVDAVTMLAFAADPHDDLALVSLLRSPMIGVEDRELAAIADAIADRGDARRVSWFDQLRAMGHSVLGRLMDLPVLASRLTADEALLAVGDALGYPSLLERLPNAARRLADWHGMVELTSQLAAEGTDTATVVARLRRLLIDPEGAGERPPVESGAAASLLTIHAAKGLEWPVVVAVDLERRPRHALRFLMDPTWGMAYKLDEEVSPHYEFVKAQVDAHDASERVRRWYVALTRARDHLIVAFAEDREAWELIRSLDERGTAPLGTLADKRFEADAVSPVPTRRVAPLAPAVLHSRVLSALRRCPFEAWHLVASDATLPASRSQRLAPDEEGLASATPVQGLRTIGERTVRYGPLLATDELLLDPADPVPDEVGLALAALDRPGARAVLRSTDQQDVVDAALPALDEIAALLAQVPQSAPPLDGTPRGRCRTCWLATRCPAAVVEQDA